MADLNIDLEVQGTEPKEKESSLKFQANARKLINGDIAFFDHALLDIVVQVSDQKVVAFPKSMAEDDQTYAAQNRFFNHLVRKGIIDRNTIQGGNAFSSIEAKILQSISEEISSLKMAVFSISKFIEEEKPEYMFDRIYKQEYNKQILEPSTEDSTELGEVPQKEKKGSMDPRIRPYGLHYRYFYEQLTRDQKKLLREARKDYEVRGIDYEIEPDLTIQDVISRWQEQGHRLRQDRPIMVPAWNLWLHREHDWKRGFSRISDEEYGELAKSLKYNGWHKDKPIIFEIGKNGVANVAEGNHRLAIVVQEIDENMNVPVWFQFKEIVHR